MVKLMLTEKNELGLTRIDCMMKNYHEGKSTVEVLTAGVRKYEAFLDNGDDL